MGEFNDQLEDKQNNALHNVLLEGEIAATAADSNLSDWQKESQIPSGSMLLLSSVNRYLEMEGLDLQEDQQMGKELLEGYEGVEELKEERLGTSQGGEEEEIVGPNNADNSMAKERPRRIHVPEHWKEYPLVLDGAIADSISHCQLSPQKLKKLSKAIKDIITTNISFPVAGKSNNLAFTTVQTYFHRTRERLCRVLGERSLPAVAQKLITPSTTYSKLVAELEMICKPPSAVPFSPMKRAKLMHDCVGTDPFARSFNFPTPVELKKAFNSRMGNKKVQIPLHWNDYPKIVMGAIDASMELCKDRILKNQIRPAVIDVIRNRKKVVHCKNTYQVAHTSLRRYVYYACSYLLRCLGSSGVNPAVAPFINASATFKQVQRLFSNKGLAGTSSHSPSADGLDDGEDDGDDDEDDQDDLVSEEPSAENGICLALQNSLQSANLLTQSMQSCSTPFRAANAWDQMEQDEMVEYKPFVPSPSKALLNRPIVRIAEEDLIERNSVSSAASLSGLRLPSLAKKLPKVYNRAETLEKSRQIQDLIRAGRFIDCIAVIEHNFPDFMEDQRELGLFLKIQKLVEQSLKLKRLNVEQTGTTKVGENSVGSISTNNTLLQTIDQGLAENVSNKINNEEELSTCSSSNKSKECNPVAVQKCELLSEMGDIAKTIASLLLEGEANNNIPASSLKEASRRVNDAFAVIHDNQGNGGVPDSVAYLMASSQWEKLADFFNMALFAHTKLQLTLDLFKD